MVFEFGIFVFDNHTLLKDGLCKCFGLKDIRKHILYTLEDYMYRLVYFFHI